MLSKSLLCSSFNCGGIHLQEGIGNMEHSQNNPVSKVDVGLRGGATGLKVFLEEASAVERRTGCTIQ
jgi:hypothetical protein